MPTPKVEPQKPIDLSAGLVPKQQESTPDAINLSSGLVPKPGGMSGFQQVDASPTQGDTESSPLRTAKNFVEGILPSTTLRDYVSGPAGLVGLGPNSLKDTYGGLWELGKGMGNAQLEEFKKAKQLSDANGELLADKSKTTGQKLGEYGLNTLGFGTHVLAGLIPGIGPQLSKAGQQAEQGDIAGGLGTAGAGVFNAVVPGAAYTKAKGIATSGSLPRPFSGILSGTMAKAPIGEELTNQQVLDSARKNKVNLDIADTTNSGVSKGIKNFATRSLGGRGTMEANTNSNLTALNDWATKQLDQLSPTATNRETVGGVTQAALKDNFNTLKNQAGQMFDALDQHVGNQNVDATGTVEATARQIISNNKAYYAAHPELLPKKAWGILEDLAQRPSKNAPGKPTGFLDNANNPIMAAATRTPTNAKIMNWAELHQLRSDLMDVYRNNPDLVSSRADGWLKQMVGSIDEAMTSSSANLSPQDQALFRQANQTWTQIKNTYDNPQHPFFHATRSALPSQVPGMLTGTPELARQVQTTLGAVKGQFQRQYLSNILDPNGDGTFDFKNLAARVNRIPNDQLMAMLGDQGAKEVRSLAAVSRRVTSNVNPSGTSDVMVPAGEIGATLAHPAIGAASIASGYGSAKALTSPKFLDYLIKPPTKVPPPTRPGFLRLLLGPTVAATTDRR